MTSDATFKRCGCRNGRRRGEVLPRLPSQAAARRVRDEWLTTEADRTAQGSMASTGTTLMDLHGIGPSGAARLLVEVGDIARFPSRPTSSPAGPAHHGHRPAT